MKTKLKILIVAILSCVTNLYSQDSNNATIYDVKKTATANPQYTLRTFFENMDKENFHPEIALQTLDFSEVKNVNRKGLASKLKMIFDAKGVILNISKVPLNADYIDSATMTQQYIISNELPEIFLQKVGNKWLFSAYSVSNIQAIYDKIFPFDASRIVDKLPEVFRYEILSVELWQYTGLVILFILSFIIAKLLKYVSKLIIGKILNYIKRSEAAKHYILPISLRLSQLLGVLIFMALLPTLELPYKLNFAIMLVIKIALPILIIMIVFKTIDAVTSVLRRIASSTATTVDDILVPFIRKGLKIIFFIFAIFYVLDTFNVNITPLIAGVSIGGLAFALAAQDTVKNIFGSVTIFADNPFTVGDYVITGSGEGTIENIGLRSTRIRTLENSVISIPNGKLMDMPIDNYGRRTVRRYNFNIRVVYSTPRSLLEQFINELRELTINNDDIAKDSIQISFFNYAESSLDIRVSVFFTSNTYAEELLHREKYNFDIYALAEKLGIDFAFNTQTVHIEGKSPDALGEKKA